MKQWAEAGLFTPDPHLTLIGTEFVKKSSSQNIKWIKNTQTQIGGINMHSISRFIRFKLNDLFLFESTVCCYLHRFQLNIIRCLFLMICFSLCCTLQTWKLSMESKISSQKSQVPPPLHPRACWEMGELCRIPQMSTRAPEELAPLLQALTRRI